MIDRRSWAICWPEPALRNQAGRLAFHPHWLGELPLRVCFRHGARLQPILAAMQAHRLPAASYAPVSVTICASWLSNAGPMHHIAMQYQRSFPRQFKRLFYLRVVDDATHWPSSRQAGDAGRQTPRRLSSARGDLMQRQSARPRLRCRPWRWSAAGAGCAGIFFGDSLTDTGAFQAWPMAHGHLGHRHTLDLRQRAVLRRRAGPRHREAPP